MGLSGMLFGNAAEISNEKLQQELSPVLVDGEQIVRGFKIVRDMFVFTDKRLILIDKQGLSGKKAEYHSIPYKSITHFAVETSGNFDDDGELKIWISGSQLPIEKEFKKNVDVVNLQKLLAYCILR